MILVQKYEDEGTGPKLVDNWYIKDTVYPGTLTYDNYEKALDQAKRETYQIRVKDHRTNKYYKENFVGFVILCHETLTPKNYRKDDTATI